MIYVQEPKPARIQKSQIVPFAVIRWPLHYKYLWIYEM